MTIDLEGRLYNIDDATEHVSEIFPNDTNLTCTLTAASGANTWSGYTELVDSGATTFSSLLATQPGHITSMVVETISDENAIYMMEFSWGASHVVIANGRFAGGTKFQAPNHTKRFWAPEFPAGQTVYYRLKTASGVADTCTIHLRYHFH